MSPQTPEKTGQPDKARPVRIAKLLKDHRIRRYSAAEFLASLRATPVHSAPGTSTAAAAYLKLLGERALLLNRQLKDCSKQLKAALDSIADAPGNEMRAARSHDHPNHARDRRDRGDNAARGSGRTTSALRLPGATRPHRDLARNQTKRYGVRRRPAHCVPPAPPQRGLPLGASRRHARPDGQAPLHGSSSSWESARPGPSIGR